MSEVKVIIQDNLGGNETITKNTPSVSKSVSDTQSEVTANPVQMAKSKKSVKNMAIATMLAKQSFSYVTSNVGKWTGNSHNQAMVDNATDLAGLGMMALVNPYIAVAVTAMRIGTTAIDQAWEDRQNRVASERALARQGFNSVNEAIGYRRNK